MFHLLSSGKEHTEQRVLSKPHMSFFFFSLSDSFPTCLQGSARGLLVTLSIFHYSSSTGWLWVTRWQNSEHETVLAQLRQRECTVQAHF